MRVGSLFTGYGGLDMAVGGDLAWYSEIEPAACKVLSAHHDAPNLGDIKKIDWATVAPVDVMTGGYPCQPFSHAGLRKGENDERHLWPYIREGISVLRPRLVLLENVRGHVTLGLREVLGEIAELGYGARWGVVRASDAGAPHQRARVFIAAYSESNGSDERPDGFDSSHGAGSWLQVATGGSNLATADTNGRQLSGIAADGNVLSVSSERGVEPATHTDSGGHGEQQDSRRVGSVEGNAESEASERQRSRGESHSGSNQSAAYTEGNEQRESAELGQVRPELGHGTDAGQVRLDFGKYEGAISRWERIIGRTAPIPVVESRGKERLNPVFVEFMMGLPEGWVTGHDLTPTKELKMLGNGVVPQQARLAIQLLERMGK
jgi:DNA (cytosine-5)-methyltransferase 1